MSEGQTKDNFTTAEEIVVQCSGGEDMPQDEGDNLIRIEEEE